MSLAVCGSSGARFPVHCVRVIGFCCTEPTRSVPSSWFTWGAVYVYVDMPENTCGVTDDVTVPEVVHEVACGLRAFLREQYVPRRWRPSGCHSGAFCRQDSELVLDLLCYSGGARSWCWSWWIAQCLVRQWIQNLSHFLREGECMSAQCLVRRWIRTLRQFTELVHSLIFFVKVDSASRYCVELLRVPRRPRHVCCQCCDGCWTMQLCCLRVSPPGFHWFSGGFHSHFTGDTVRSLHFLVASIGVFIVLVSTVLIQCHCGS